MKNFLLHALLWGCAVVHAAEPDSMGYRLIDLDEAVVAASKSSQKRNDMPTAVSVVTAKELERAAVLGLKDLNATMPNVYMPDFGSSLSTPIYIRGVGSRRSPSVGMYYDGVPLLEESTFDFDLDEVEAVEVLRGPQGTLYGRNAMGGIVNVVVRSPLQREGADLKLRMGSYSLGEIGGTYYGRIRSNLGYSAGLSYKHRGGYFTNIYNNERVDVSNAVSARAAMEWQHEGWHVKGFAQYYYREQGGYAYAPLDSTGRVQEVNYDGRGVYRRGVATVGLGVEKRLANGVMLRSATSFQNLDDRMGIDQDFTPVPLYASVQEHTKNIITQEFVASRPAASDRVYSWIVGAFGFYENGHRNTYITTSGTTSLRHYGEPDAGFAVYHQSALRIARGLTVEAGLRLDMERIGQDYRVEAPVNGVMTIVGTPLSTGKTFTQLTPKVAVRYVVAPRNTLYASVLRGYKAGGFNTAFDTGDDRTYRPEYSWNYELGAHFSMMGGRLTGDAAVFYTDWRNQQITQPLASGQGTHITNAGRSYSAGAELALRYRPTEALTVGMSYGLTRAKYREFVYSAMVDYSGRYTQQVPRQTIGATAHYSLHLGSRYADRVEFAAQYSAVGRTFWNDANTASQAFYGLLNAGITAYKNNISVEAWVKNALDTDYKSYYFTSLGNVFAQKGNPVAFGTTLRINL